MPVISANIRAAEGLIAPPKLMLSASPPVFVRLLFECGVMFVTLQSSQKRFRCQLMWNFIVPVMPTLVGPLRMGMHDKVVSLAA